MNLFQYQIDAVENERNGLLPVTQRALKSPADEKELIILKAFTGAGKTNIAAHFINSLLKHSDFKDKDVCVLWLSTGTGKLHIQSGNRLAQILDPDITVKVIEDSSDFSDQELENKAVYVINWEKLNNLDKKTGEFIQSMLREGEGFNLASARKKSGNMHLVLIIDEFHRNYGTKSSEKIIELLDPEVIVGITATPRKTQWDEATTKAKIPVSKIVEAQIIKKGILFNSVDEKPIKNLATDDYKSINEVVLRRALTKRKELEEKFKDIGENIIPLLLIQFDDDPANAGVLETRELLEEMGETNFAIWISADSKSQPDTKLRSNDEILRNLSTNDIKILLFKQAIATGWDCPRAHVLLRYRRIRDRKDTETPCTFDIQTLGRIMRTPNKKHYNDDDLNYGYVFTPSENNQLEKDFLEAWGEEAENLKKHEVKLPELSQSDQQEITAGCQNTSPEGPPYTKREHKLVEGYLYVEETLQGRNMVKIYDSPDENLLSAKIEKIVSNTQIATDTDKLKLSIDFKEGILNINDDLLKTEKLKDIIMVNDEKSYNVQYTPADIEKMANTQLERLIGQKRYSPIIKDVMKNSIRRRFKKEIKDWSGSDEDYTRQNCLIIANEKFIKTIIDKLDKFIAQENEPSFSKNNYEFPRAIKTSAQQNDQTKNLYGCPLPSDASKPEKIFADFLDRRENVIFWHKNSDRGASALCVPYKKNNRLQAAYPDFIVLFENQAKELAIGIYEIKDSLDKDEATEPKGTALSDLAADINRNTKSRVYAGIIHINQNIKAVEISDTGLLPTF